MNSIRGRDRRSSLPFCVVVDFRFEGLGFPMLEEVEVGCSRGMVVVVFDIVVFVVEVVAEIAAL